MPSTCSGLTAKPCNRCPLIERKQRLRELVQQPSVLLYATHVQRTGREFFRAVCEQDLEGIVAKLKHGACGEWGYKIRNPQYLSRTN